MKITNKLIATLLFLATVTHNANAQSWSITGNSGTSGATNFVGTTDNVSFKIRTNNTLRVTVANNGKVGVGNFSPIFKLDVKGGSINTDSLYRIKGVQVLNRDASNNIQIGDVTAKVSIGEPSSPYNFHVKGNTLYAGHFVNTAPAQDNFGVYGECQNTAEYGVGVEGIGGYVGVYGIASFVGSGARKGVRGNASGGNVNFAFEGIASGGSFAYGVHGLATGATTTYGVYGSALNGTNNYAGYFDEGNVYVRNKVGINISSPQFALDAASDLSTVGNFVNTVVSTDNFGVIGQCNNTPFYGIGVKGLGGFIGVHGESNLIGSGSRYGVRGLASGGTTNNTGMIGGANGGIVARGVHGSAYGAVTNWAGYFEEGNVYVKNRIRVGTDTMPYYSLDILSPDYTAASIKSSVNGGTTFIVDASALTGNIWAIHASAPLTGYAGYFNGDVFCSGTYQPSDEKLKENIQPLENVLDKVLKLDVKTYLFKQGLDKMNLAVEKQNGFIAQNLESVFPELVRLNAAKEEQPLEFKAVNYTGMIPVLTKAIQELNTKIENLEKQNELLQSDLAQCCLNSRSGSGSNAPDAKNKAGLEQNIPNPFTEITTIKYYIPVNALNSIIKIYSADGAELKSIPVSTKGFGQTEISGSSLAAGIYTYLLLVDGKVVDTKQMILTK